MRGMAKEKIENLLQAAWKRVDRLLAATEP
jgi:hypothetical protein